MSPSSSATTTDGVSEQILAAASAEFAAKGMRGASVRSIAERAATTAAMINYYYGSKQALYDVVVERAQARLFATVTAVLRDVEPAHVPSRLAGAYFDFLAEERDLPRLLLREILDEGDGVQSLLRKYVDPLRALLENEFGAGDETFQAAVSAFGAIAGYFMYAPVLGALLGEDPLGTAPLARRREHVMALADMLKHDNVHADNRRKIRGK